MIETVSWCQVEVGDVTELPDKSLGRRTTVSTLKVPEEPPSNSDSETYKFYNSRRKTRDKVFLNKGSDKE